MEENLDKNNEVNKEISGNTTKSNSNEIKEAKSEEIINIFLIIMRYKIIFHVFESFFSETITRNCCIQ